MSEVAELWLEVVSPEAAEIIRSFLDDAKTQASIISYNIII